MQPTAGRHTPDSLQPQQPDALKPSFVSQSLPHRCSYILVVTTGYFSLPCRWIFFNASFKFLHSGFLLLASPPRKRLCPACCLPKPAPACICQWNCKTLGHIAAIWRCLCVCLTIPRCMLKEPIASSTVVHKNHHCQGKPMDIRMGKHHGARCQGKVSRLTFTL